MLRLPPLLVAVLVAAPLAAQGTRADYERAERLSRQARASVLNATLDVQWSADGSQAWFRKDLGGGAGEYYLARTEPAGCALAFDHAKLATALGAAAKKDLDPRRLNFDRVEFTAAGDQVIVLLGREAWDCDLQTYTITPAKRPPAEGRPRGDRGNTRRGGETEVTFVNETAGNVELFWRDPAGDKKSYGTLKPGESRRQHTFVGHVWVAEDARGNVLNTFEAADRRRFVIGKRAPQNDDDEEDSSPPEAERDTERRDTRVVVRDCNVYWRESAGAEERPLTDDGTEDNAYQGGVHWSPDGKYFFVLRTQPEQKHLVQIVESSPRDQLQPKLHEHQYLKPGDRVAVSKPALFVAATGKRIPLDDALYANPWSLDHLRWERDSSRFTFLFNQRGHQALRLIAVNVPDGKTTAIVNEESKTFINYSGKFLLRQLPETDEVIWMSERDGWNHLYLYDARTGAVKNSITSGRWVVRGVDRIDEKQRRIWFRAGGLDPAQDPYFVHHCRVDFDGGNLTRLTDGDGTHAIEYSPDGKFYVDTYSRVDLPPVHELRRARDGAKVCELTRADASRLKELNVRLPERFVAKGRDGETDIYGIICRPSNFDPSRKYPVIEHIYAGPQSAFTPKKFAAWHGNLQTYAELGFIVVQLDGMGTSHRSKAFHDVCWKNLADAGFPDRIAWLKAAAKHEPALDLSRVGIFGGSAGGQNALGALLLHGDFYKAAAADCGCHDNRMDKIWWNEQWMGWPIDKHYAEQSNVTLAKNLRGKLLLTVGELDTNVDPASTMQVANALIKADKDFDLLVIPGGGHGSGESPYADRRRKDFFVRHLLGVEPRHD